MDHFERPGRRTSAEPGADRSSLLPTMAVVAVVLLFAAGLPLLDTFLTPTRRVVAAGTQVDLITSDERPAISDPPGDPTVRFVPAAGWEQTDEGEERYDRVALTNNGVSFELRVTPAPDGTDCGPALDRAESRLQEDDGSGRLHRPQTFTTDSGQVGVTAPFIGARVEALVFAVCSRGVSATMVASGPVGALQGVAADADPVVGMARSVEIG